MNLALPVPEPVTIPVRLFRRHQGRGDYHLTLNEGHVARAGPQVLLGPDERVFTRRDEAVQIGRHQESRLVPTPRLARFAIACSAGKPELFTDYLQLDLLGHFLLLELV